MKLRQKIRHIVTTERIDIQMVDRSIRPVMTSPFQWTSFIFTKLLQKILKVAIMKNYRMSALVSCNIYLKKTNNVAMRID